MPFLNQHKQRHRGLHARDPWADWSRPESGGYDDPRWPLEPAAPAVSPYLLLTADARAYEHGFRRYKKRRPNQERALGQETT